MECRVLCPSLPELLRKTILTFCQGSIHFEHCLEVTGSLHVRSDNHKVATFLLDEKVSRPLVGENSDQGIDLSLQDSQKSLEEEKSIKVQEEEEEENEENSNMPKKPRKLKRPVRKVAHDYNENYESSDAEAEFDYSLVDQNQNETDNNL